jgi:glutathione S-transferase
MTYELLIADRTYSSWSLRGWLCFAAFGIPVTVRTTTLYTPDFVRDLADFAPARSVPALRLPDGTVMADSLAIAEELASRHPGAGHWPADPAFRAIARMLCAEMHSGFAPLRSHCPMNLRVSYADCAPPPAVLADLDRIQLLWAHALARSGGPWLCGPYSLADAFFAPVAMRIAGYNLPVGHQGAAYVARHLAHGPFRDWRALALTQGPDHATYARDWPTRPWPA